MITYVTAEKLSAAGADKFSKDMEDLIKKGDDILLNLKNTLYITSVCIRTLLTTYKKLHKQGLKLKATNLTPFVQEVFEMTNLVELLDIN